MCHDEDGIQPGTELSARLKARLNELTSSLSPGRLTPPELAEAAILATMAVLAVVLARLTPFAGLTTVVGAIPFAVLALRHRSRVLVVSFWVAVVLVFLLAGFNAATQVLVMVLFGGVVGRAHRDKWSPAKTMGMALLIGWVGVASLTLGFLAVFGNLRRLNLEAARVQWAGMSRGLGTIGLDRLVETADPFVQSSIDRWYVSVPVFQLLVSLWLTWFLIRLGEPVLRRVERAFGPRPVPGEKLSELADQLRATDGGQVIIVRGDNGAGKTTLLRAIAAAESDVGLPGGVAWIGQRPESQVIGVRVADDLRWGLSEPPDDDQVARVLEQVELSGFAERETGTLSGGELQRLALASALLRRPRMLLSDESTAMIDPAGRRVIRRILRQLADAGTAVIHVSHLEEDASLGDLTVELS